MSAVFDNNGQADSMAATTSTPVIVSTCVNGTTVTVSWTDDSPAPNTAYYTVTLDSGDGKYSINFPDQSVKLPKTANRDLSGEDYPPDLGQVFTATVAAYDDQGNETGPPSSKMVVALTAPVLTGASVSGQQLTVAWNNAFPMPGVATYMATLNCAQDPNFSLNGPSVTAVGAPTCTFAIGALDLDKTYNVVVAGYTGDNNASPNSNVVNLVLAHVGARVEYQAKPSVVKVTPAALALAPALTGNVAELYDGDQLIATGTNSAPGAAITIAPKNALAPGRNYTVRTAGRITAGDCSCAVSTGPFGPAIAVLAGMPDRVSANYDGDILTVVWGGVADAAALGYTMTLSDGAVFNCGLQTVLTVPYSIKTQPAATVQVNAFGANTTGPASAPATVAGPAQLRAPAILSASYDGELLFVDWSPVAVPNVLGYTVILSDGATKQAISSGTQTNLAYPCVLDPGAKWSVVVAAVGYGGMGTASTPAAVTLAPALAAPTAVSARYDGALLVIDWTMPALGRVRGHVVTLSGGGTSQVINTGPETALVLPFVLDTAKAWTVTVAAAGWRGAGTASAPATVAAPALLPAPVGIAARYDGAILVVDWHAVSVPNVLGYAVTVSDGTTPRTINTGPETALALPIVLDTAKTWSVTVASVGYAGAGQASAGVAVTGPAPLPAPGGVNARYDGAELVVGWQAQASPNVLGYAVALTDGSSTQTIETGTETTLVQPIVLDLAKTWKVTVATIGYGGTGTASAPAKVAAPALLAPPASITARYDGAELVVGWHVPAVPNVLGYSVVLGDGTTSQTIDTGPVTTLVLPVVLALTKSWTVTVATIGFAGTGSASEQVAVAGPLALVAPAGLAARYDGAELVVDWQPLALPNVLGYVLTLSDDSATSTINTGPDTTVTLPVVLDLAKTWTVTVAAIGYGGTGPASTQVTVAAPALLPAPSGLNARYDGVDLVLGWQALASPNVLGYVVTLTDGATTQTIETGTETALVLPIVLDLAKTWQVKVATIGHGGTGAASAFATVSAPALLPPPAGIAARYDGAELVVDWQALALPNVLGYVLTLSDGAASRTIRTGPDTTVALPIVLDLAKTWTATVAAIGYGGTGPASTQATVTAPVLLPAPAGLSARYDGVQLVLDWMPVALPNVLGYAVTLSGGASPQTFTTGLETTLVRPLALDTTKAWTVTAATIGYAGAGTAGAAATVAMPSIAAAPALLAVSFEDGLLRLRWAPLDDAAVVAYQVTLTAGGRATTVRTAESHLSVPADPTAVDLRVAVRALGHGFAGPDSDTVNAIMASPAAIHLSTDPATGAAALSWTAAELANSYLLDFEPWGRPTTVNTTSYPIPSASFTPNAPLRVSIAGIAADKSAAVTGPRRVLMLPAGAPHTFGAEYDGVTASVQWDPVPGASGYTMTVLASASGTTTAAAGATTPANARSGTVALTAERGKAYTVVVQAEYGASGTGAPSAPLALFASAFFTSSSAASSAYPFVYPATTLDTVLDPDSAKHGEAITLYLPELGPGSGASPQLQGLPVTQGAFTLALNPDSASKASYPYTLAIGNQATGGSNPWFFGTTPPATSPSAIRRGVLNDYLAFLIAVESKGAGPAGIGYLQNIIGRCLPQTFAELLYCNYGLSLLDPTAGVTLGSIDVRPGMVLRVANAAYQRVPAGTDQPLLDGFVGGSVTDYEVGAINATDGGWSVGFDALIGQLVASETLQVAAPPGDRPTNTQAGGADAADLYFDTFKGPFYRLFIPSTLIGADSAGSQTLSANFVLASASSYAALCTTTNVLNPAGSNMLAYFRGRSIVKPCIRVSVDGATMVVPIGTTVRNLLELRGSLPPALTGQALRGVALERSLGGAVFDPAGVPDGAASYRLRMDWRSAGATLYGPQWDVLAMPLLAGDRIRIAG